MFAVYPSFSRPGLVALQWTLVRRRPLTPAEAAAPEPAPFELDACAPLLAGGGGAEAEDERATACY